MQVEPRADRSVSGSPAQHLLGLSLPQAVEVELKTSHPVPTKQLARFDELAARLADAEDSYAVAVRADTDAAQAAATALAKLDGVLSQRYRVSALLDHVRKYGRGNAEAAMRQAMQLQAELAAAESENRQAIRQAEEISEVTRAASLNALLAREAAHIALRSAMPMISAQTPDWGPDIPLPVLVANYRDALVKALVADEVEARSYERTVQLLPPLKPARPSEPSQLPDQPDLSDQAHLSDQPQAEERSQPGAGAGPSAQLLAGGMAFTDEELLRALRSRQAELEHQADELDSQVVAAQERLGTMVKKARERSEEAEGALVATMLSWAREEAVATLEDARRRAAELGMSTDAPNGLGTLGKLLVTHFELQERLVNLTAEMALEVPSSD